MYNPKHCERNAPAPLWMADAAAAVWPRCWTMLHLVCVTGSQPGCAETDYSVWTYVTLDTHQLPLPSVVWFQTSEIAAELCESVSP